MMNKKKRKLRAPIASLSDKQFLLSTPNTNHETPNRGNHSISMSSSSSSSSVFPILNRQNLTYTPMTRKLLQKQQQFVAKKYPPILPSISCTNSLKPILAINNNNNNNNNNNKESRKKKRKFAEIEADESNTKSSNNMYNTPIIPGSVRKKRRLNSSSSKQPSIKAIHSTNNKNKNKMTNSAKKKVMKKVLNNEFNPSLSLSQSQDINTNTTKLLIDYNTSPVPSSSPSIDIDIKMKDIKINNINNNNNNNNNNELSMILDFNTPSKSTSNQITPSETHNTDKKRKRRLSASRDSISNLVMSVTEQHNDNQMVSRRRRKRHSLSSNAIKKKIKKPKKKLFENKKEVSPFDVVIPCNVKRTYKRQRSKSISRSISRSLSKSISNEAIKQQKEEKQEQKVNICPLLTKLIEDRGHPSQIAFISHYILSKLSLKMDIKQQNIFRKIDSLLALLSRAEIILNNDERTRLKQIDSFNNQRCNDEEIWSDEWQNIYRKTRKKSNKSRNKNKNKNVNKCIVKRKSNKNKNKNKDKNKNKNKNKKRVRFCCYDMSTVTTPEFGELDSIKHLQSICRLLVQSAKIASKLFNIKSNYSWTRKSIKMFIDELKQYIFDINNISNSNSNTINNGKEDELSHSNTLRMFVAKYVLKQFEDGYNHKIEYPFCEKVQQHLSSLIRFYIKTIWNASEFLDGKKDKNNNNNNNNIKIPKWYLQIGTYSIFSDDLSEISNNYEIPSDAEFIPYHAAELSINLESYYNLQNMMKNNNDNNNNKSIEELMNELGIIDNPMIFFNEMKQVLININVESIYGETLKINKKNKNKNKNKKKQTHDQFDKYLETKWKELKSCLRDVENTKSHQLYFYLPLLDFKQFLNSIQITST